MNITIELEGKKYAGVLAPVEESVSEPVPTPVPAEPVPPAEPVVTEPNV